MKRAKVWALKNSQGKKVAYVTADYNKKLLINIPGFWDSLCCLDVDVYDCHDFGGHITPTSPYSKGAEPEDSKFAIGHTGNHLTVTIAAGYDLGTLKLVDPIMGELAKIHYKTVEDVTDTVMISGQWEEDPAEKDWEEDEDEA